jgi:nitrogen fixation/metabolism regulation signal transduction histidine kinase
VWLLVQHGPQLTVIGASDGAPGRVLALEMLRKTSSEPVWWEAPALEVLLGCQRGLGERRLWVVRRIREAELLPQLLEGTGLVARWEPAGAARGVEALRVTPLAGKQLVLEVSQTPAAPAQLTAPPPRGMTLGLARELTRSLTLIGLAGLLGGLSAWLATRTTQREERVLRELERAAERVAGGDLSSTINLRVGGRADQTFQRFDRMTQELRETRARLADAERAAAFQDIARRIAHEIKNPLSPIRMAMETLRKARQKRLASFDEIFEESTRAVLDEVMRLERIVREFSEFARLPKPRPGALSLSALVEEVVALYRPADVAVQVTAEAALPSVRADREQMTQVLVNLLQNAFDAARGAAEPLVHVRVERAGAQLLLHVDDNGPGVPAAERARIFEPYVTSKPQGTGLGLAIVARILADHGATIAVGESPLRGARFSVGLPIEGAAQSVSMP